MKKIFFSILILPFFTMAQSPIVKVEISAIGLTCSMCSNAINKQLKSLPSVEKVEIDLNKNVFTVSLQPNNNLTPNSFRKKIEDAGFFVGLMNLYLKLNNVTVTENKKVNDFIFIDNKEQLVNGIVKAKVLDKGFLSAKEHKKLILLYNKYPSFNKNEDADFHLKLY